MDIYICYTYFPFFSKLAVSISFLINYYRFPIKSYVNISQQINLISHFLNVDCPNVFTRRYFHTIVSCRIVSRREIHELEELGF